MAHYLTSIVELNDEVGNSRSADLNPLIARGAFGHVDIALLVHWASSSETTSTPSSASVSAPARPQSVSLAAIKTIPHATLTSGATTPASLTREAFAELNALRLLNGHENVTPLLGFYGARDGPNRGSGGGFGGWGWAEDSLVGKGTSSPSSLCLVFPYHPVDLADALNYRRLKALPRVHSFYLPPVVLQSIMRDILSGLQHLHGHRILHRDLKPSNLYITMDGRIQLGDFGLAKAVPAFSDAIEQEKSSTGINSKNGTDNSAGLTKGLCTLQYRPPELLLGGTGIIHESRHGTNGMNGAFDIWSAGCIFAELITLSGPLFSGQSVIDQLGRIFRVLGTPTDESWPGVRSLPDWNKIRFEPTPGTGLQEKIASEDLWNSVGGLMSRLLSLNPLNRPSAQSSLSDVWLQSFGDSFQHAHQSVVNELIPSFLQISSHVYFSYPNKPNADEECRNTYGNQNGDSFAYAKHHASNLASFRRAFPQPKCNDSSSHTESKERWKCQAN